MIAALTPTGVRGQGDHKLTANRSIYSFIYPSTLSANPIIARKGAKFSVNDSVVISGATYYIIAFDVIRKWGDEYKSNANYLNSTTAVGQLFAIGIPDKVAATANVDKLALRRNLIDKDPNLVKPDESKPNVTALSTNFILPAVRINRFEKGQESNNSRVSLDFLSSIGVGLNISRGQIQEDGYYKSHFGLQVGCLLSKSDKAATDNNSVVTFAPTISLSVLDFQFGWGYDFGNVSSPVKRGFLSLAYGIPLQKLSPKSSILRAKRVNIF